MRHVAGEFDVCVVGGGLAGLTAAALLAQEGRRVALFERSDTIGGRAITTVERGYALNLGPHAWYIGGPGTRVLSRLGIPLQGRTPRPSGAFALLDGALHTLPIGFVSLLTTNLLSAHGKLEAARLLARLPRVNTSVFDEEALAAWLAREIGDDRARAVINMFVRVAMYANAPTLLSAGTSLAAFQSVLRHNVRYLDGGWQPVVDALRAKAAAVGVEIVRSAPVVEVVHDASVRGVRLHDGRVVPSATVLLAVPPAIAVRLVPNVASEVTRQWTGIPSRAACLDVGLARLPRPANTLAFGVEEPLYYSVHSATAAVAPAGGATIHVAKYLDVTKDPDAAGDRRELESFMDVMQPGWRTEVVVERFLPSMTVANTIPLAESAGLRGRPAVEVREVPGLFLAGDWVGSEGTLANASVTSAARAARLVVDRRHARAVRTRRGATREGAA